MTEDCVYETTIEEKVFETTLEQPVYENIMQGGVVINNEGEAISGGIVLSGAGTGFVVSKKTQVVIPYNGTITGYSITSTEIGTISFDVWKDNGVIPNLGDSIVDGNYIELDSSDLNIKTDLSSWSNTNLTKNDIMVFYCRQASDLKDLTLTLFFDKG